MLQLFRNNSPYTVILLFLFALLIKLQALLYPVAPVALPQHALYALVLRITDWVLRGSAFGYAFFALVLLFGQAIYLNAIVVRHRLFGKATYLPAFVYIAFSSLAPSFSQFSPALLVNFCLLGALDVMLRFGQTLHPRRHVFNAGFLLALSSLLQFSAIAGFLLFVFALIMLRPFNIGEWVVALLGYLTPFYFFACILFLADVFPLLRRWPELGVSLPQQIASPVHMITAITGVLILLIGGFFSLQGQMARSTIYVRRSWSVVVATLVSSFLAATFSPASVPASWLMILPAAAMVASGVLHLEKGKRLSTFAFLFILAFTVFCQFALHK